MTSYYDVMEFLFIAFIPTEVNKIILMVSECLKFLQNYHIWSACMIISALNISSICIQG